MDDKEIRKIVKEEIKKALHNQSNDKISKLQLGVNITMVIVTLIYVILTFGLFKTTTELNSISIRPYVAFQNLDLKLASDQSNGTTAQFGIKLKNVGDGIANYEVTNISLKIDGIPNLETKFVEGQYSIYPEEETTYSIYPISISNLTPDNIVGLNGILEYTIKYSAAGRKTMYTTHRKIKFVIDSIDTSGHVQITYFYEPGNAEN